jgi:hypothetical protein
MVWGLHLRTAAGETRCEARGINITEDTDIIRDLGIFSGSFAGTGYSGRHYGMVGTTTAHHVGKDTWLRRSW